MPEPLGYLAAILMGLLGSLHCVGMCGGIMGALAMAVPPEQRVRSRLLPLLLSYNAGRILSYGLAGALFGSVTGLLAQYFAEMGFVLRMIAALMLIAMGLYLANWWPVLRHLERAGGLVWNYLQPGIKHLTPVKTPVHALLIGALWGWIPCGLIYSALTWAAMSADWRQAGLTMLCFGLGTLPAVLATGIMLEQAKRLLQNRWTRSGAGLLLIAFGLWTLPLSPFSAPGSHGGHDPHALMSPAAHPAPQHRQDQTSAAQQY